jgi:hypothetical protein
MNLLKLTPRILISATILILASSCGQSIKPVAIETIPVYENAEPVSISDSDEALMVITPIRTEIAEQAIALEANAYTLPANIVWSDVKRFYTEKLQESDWKPADQLWNEAQESKSIGWDRASGDDDLQILIITFVPNISRDGATLVILLFSEARDTH